MLCARCRGGGRHAHQSRRNQRSSLCDLARKPPPRHAHSILCGSSRQALAHPEAQIPIGNRLRPAGSCMRDFRTPDGTRNPSASRTFTQQDHANRFGNGRREDLAQQRLRWLLINWPKAAQSPVNRIVGKQDQDLSDQLQQRIGNHLSLFEGQRPPASRAARPARDWMLMCFSSEGRVVDEQIRPPFPCHGRRPQNVTARSRYQRGGSKDSANACAPLTQRRPIARVLQIGRSLGRSRAATGSSVWNPRLLRPFRR